MKDSQFVPSQVNTKATAALAEEVKHDLEVPDPPREQAQAVIQPKEETDG